jgi:DNA-binding transcriptional LysR family regulator
MTKSPPVVSNLARLDLLSIRLVLLCAQYGSLSDAAPHANLSLTGASHRLAALEGRLGIKLFDRGPRGLRPTASGSTFLNYARPLVDLAYDLDRAVRLQAATRPSAHL